MKYLYTLLGILILSSLSSIGLGQAYTSGYPSVTNVQATQITFNSNITNTGGYTYYTKILIKPRGAGAVVGEVNALSTHTITVTSPDQEFSVDITGLVSETDYTAYCVSYFYNPSTFSNEYIEGALSNPATAVDFTTAGTPPPNYVLGFPNVTEIKETQITFNTNITNTEGHTYYTKILVKPRDAGASIGEVNALATNTITISNSNEVYSTIISGLSSGTNYTAYCVSYFYNPATYTNEYIELGAPAGPATAVDFTTGTPLDIITYTPGQNAIDVALNLNPQLLFNQNIQFVSPIPFSGSVYIREQGTNREIQQYPFSPGTSNPNLTISGNAFTIELTQDLEANTATYITIPSGIIESISGEIFNGINNAADNNWRFTTVGAPEWGAGYPQTRNISMINVDIVGRTDKAGTYYYVVTNSATVPSIAQIKNGLNHNGTEALFHNSASPGTMTANTEFVDALNIDGLDIVPTTYYVYYVAVSGIGLDSSIGTATFTTVERDAPTATFNPLNGATGVSVSSNIVVTYNEPVRNLDGSVIDNTNAKNLVNIPGFSDYSVTIDATKQILTITPNSPFASSTTYSVIINPVEDWFGNEQSGVMSSSFTTSDFVTWNGSVSTDWSNLANWTGTLAPGFNALIPAAGITNWPDVTTNTSFYANDIVIEAGAELNISSTGTLLVTGYFIMVSSNAGKGNASLINNGTLNISSTNKVQIQQNVTDSPVKWYYISSPVAGASQSSIGCDGSMQIWDTSVGEFATISPATTMESARGYRSWSNSNMVFSGAINNASEYSYVANQTAKNPYGWELVGNPYPCSVDWGGIGNTGLLDAFWIWINDQSKYGTYNGNSLLGTNLDLISPAVIPSNQAFWVRVAGEGYLGASGTVTIPRAARTHNQTTYLKAANQARQAVVRLTAINGSKTDEVVVAFNPEALDSFDDFDSEKLFAPTYANHLDIYSFTREELLTINAYSELISDRAIPLGVKVPKDGTFEIKLSELRNIADDTQVLIEDKVEKTITDMRESNFVFTAKAGKIEERFVLHVKPNVATSVGDVATGRVKIYSNGKTVYLEVGDLTNPTYKVHTLSGQMIMQGKLLPGVLNSTEINYEGVVIVTISSKESVLSEKVFVK